MAKVQNSDQIISYARLVPIGSIKENKKNPRFIRDDKFIALVKSLREAPWMLKLRPIVLNADMMPIGGNMRFRAAKEAGLKEVWALDASNLTQEQQEEFIIKDNVGFGEWDYDMLRNEWDTEKLAEWGLDVPDFFEADETEEKDLSDKIKSQFKIEVVCADEGDQEKAYNHLIELGYECRILSL